MIHFYASRIDTHDVSFINSFLAEYTTGTWMYCLEGTDNPHCHMYFESTLATKKELDKMRYSIRKLVGSGNKAYMLKKCEHMPMKYFAYMTKEGRYFHKGLSEETLKEALEYDDNVKSDLKNKSTSRMTILQKIEHHYGYAEAPPSDARAIIHDVIQYYRDTETLVREFAIISQVQTLTLKHIPKYADLLQDRVFEKIFGNNRPIMPDNGLWNLIESINEKTEKTR